MNYLSTNLDNMSYTFSLCFHPAIYRKFKSCYPSVKGKEENEKRMKERNKKRNERQTKDYVAVM